jgi:hypothetical protein
MTYVFEMARCTQTRNVLISTYLGTFVFLFIVRSSARIISIYNQLLIYNNDGAMEQMHIFAYIICVI